MKSYITFFFLIVFNFTTAVAAPQIESAYEWILLNSSPKPLSSFSIRNGKIYPGGEEDQDPIKGADIATFKVAVKGSRKNFWAKDKNHVYFSANVLSQADVKTFVLLSEQIAKDKNHVYCWDFNKGGFSGELNTLGNPNTFKMLTSPGDLPDSQFWYYRDANHIFSKWCTLVDGADPNSFEMVPNPTTKFDAKDKWRKYSLGRASE